MFARLGYTLNDRWNGYFFGMVSDNSSEDPGPEGADASQREGTYETQSALASLTIRNAYENAQGHIKLYRNAGEGNWLDQPTRTAGVTEDLFNDFEFYGIKVKESFGLWDTMEIVAGFDWEHTEGDYEKYFSDGATDHWRGHDVSMLSTYAAVSREFGNKEGLLVTPSAGVRYYDNSDFGAEWSSHAGVVIGFGPISGHFGYSRGVVFPGLDVVVFSEEVIPVLGDSWMELDPEIMDHYEVGLSYVVSDAAEVDVVWFCNDGRDRYVFVTSPTSMPVYDNVEEYTTKGVEVTANIHPTANLAFFLGGTYMRTDPSDTPYAPELTLSAGLTWRFLEAFTFSADAQYSDEMFVRSQARRATATNTALVDSFTVLNAKLSYAFTTGSNGLSGTVFIAGENLTDTSYEYRPDYPMPGINGMVGMTVTF
jgi:iron complex outermembrane receptor protein